MTISFKGAYFPQEIISHSTQLCGKCLSPSRFA